MPSGTMTLQEAADHLGVHYMTAYRYVRTGRLAATKVGGGWRVQRSALDAMGANVISEGGSRPPADWSARLENRLVAGDETGAWNVVESALSSGMEPDDIHLGLIAPALADIGEGWANGEVTIAEEHRATGVTMRLIGRLGPRFNRPGRTRGTIVVGAPAGDQHSVPVAIAADLLRGRGFEVIDLGANSPADSFVDAARIADRLVAVGISSSHSGNETNIAAIVDEVRSAIGCPVVVGGHGIGPVESEGIGADFVTRSADDMLEIFDRIADGSEPSAD